MLRKIGTRYGRQLWYSAGVEACTLGAKGLQLGDADSPVVRLLPGLQRRCCDLAPGRGRVISFPLAQTGEGIAECELVEWFVQEGEEVEEFSELCQVQSDKAAVEITSRYAGTIRKLHHSPGEMVKVGAPLVDIELEADSDAEDPQLKSSTPSSCQAAAAAAGERESAPGADTREAGSAAEQRVQAAPAVRAFAREHSVRLANVTPSGPDLRIVKQDILRHLASHGNGTAGVKTERSDSESEGSDLPPHRPQLGDDSATAEPARRASTVGADDRRGEAVTVPLRGYQRAMVRSMTEAATIPTFYFCDEVCMDALIQVRRELNSAAPSGANVTVLAFAVKALSLALAQHPHVNARLSQDLTSRIQYSSHNVGIAMATASGLVVPNIKNVQHLSVLDIARQLDRLKQAAAAAQLHAADLSGGTITLSNIGSIGGTYALPLVNPPELAICALGRLRQAWRPDTNTASSVMNISWGADHRALDGAALALFCNSWKAYLEAPSTCMLHLK